MLCLSGLLACSKDKTEDVPPVPPGSEEIPDKLELKAGDTDFNSLAYTVTAGKDGNEYLHVVYDKSFYDGVEWSEYFTSRPTCCRKTVNGVRAPRVIR